MEQLRFELDEIMVEVKGAIAADEAEKELLEFKEDKIEEMLEAGELDEVEAEEAEERAYITYLDRGSLERRTAAENKLIRFAEANIKKLIKQDIQIIFDQSKVNAATRNKLLKILLEL